MTHNFIFKPLTASMLLSLSFFSLSALAAPVAEPSPTAIDNSNPVIDLPEDNDQASELIKRENQTLLLGNTVPSAKVTDAEAQEAIRSRQQAGEGLAYDLAALKADPILFTKFLNGALAAQDMVTVKQLLPHYKALEVNDPMLINFADALVYRSEAKNKQAIAKCQRLILIFIQYA